MRQPHWFSWFIGQLDHKSLYLFGGTITFGTITQLTANEITAFFTAMVGMTTMIYNVVKTRNEMRKEKDRQKREKEGRPPVWEPAHEKEDDD